MRQIFAASFLLLTLAACDKNKSTETTVHCWTCVRDVYRDDGNSQLTKTHQDSTDVCGLNEEDIKNYEIRNQGRKLLNMYYGDMKCYQKDSI